MSYPNYTEAARLYPSQKAALTRALTSDNADRILTTCQKAVRAWERCGTWPDDWSRWQRALDDTFGWGVYALGDFRPDLTDL